MNIILLENESVGLDLRPKINVGHSDLYFMASDFALYLEDYLMD